MPLDPYAFQNAFNLSLDRGRQRRADQNALAQQGIQNERQRLQDMYLAAGQQREATRFEQEQQDRASALDAAKAKDQQNAAILRDQSAKRAAEIARDALKIQDPVQRKGFLQRAVPAYADDFKVLGIDLNELPAMLTMADQDLAAELEQVAALGMNAQSDNDPVQSAQILANGNIGYLTRSGKVVDTGQRAKEQLQLTEMAGGRGIANLRDQSFTPLSTAAQESAAAAAQASAVEAAKAGAKNTADNAQSAVQNRRAYDVYIAGIQQLEKRLNTTQTDPITGRVIPLTANAQAAEGAISAMAPVLKGLFRQAGEGAFTDRDQAMLIEMLPTRKDHPEARKAKIESINAIVKAKLGASPAPANAGGGPIRVNTPEEAAALPSGTEFITPDGRRKVRP